MVASARFARDSACAPGVEPAERVDDIKLVVDEYLVPAADAVKRSADEGDVEAVRAYASELLMATGTVIAACPRPRARPPGG